MKKLLLVLALMMSFSALADSLVRPWPRLSVWSNAVDVRIDNYDDRDYRCSGTVWIYFESGRSRAEYVSLFVYARRTAFRKIVNYNPQERIRRATHSISCF